MLHDSKTATAPASSRSTGPTAPTRSTRSCTTRLPTRCAPRPPTTTSRVVVFTGAGKAFCAGTDLLEMAETVDAASAATRVTRTGFPAFVDVLQEFPKPLLAAVNGAAVGLGFTMLAHCDLVFVSDNARLLAPFTNMGVAPEAASSYLLPRRMGRQQASLSLFTSDWISAEDAVATGLAVRQCAPTTLVDETHGAGHPHRVEVAPVAHGDEAAAARRRARGHRPRPARSRTRRSPSSSRSRTRKDGVLGQLD